MAIKRGDHSGVAAALGKLDPASRDRVTTAFRHKTYEAIGFQWFAHQAEWQLAAEGWTLTPLTPNEGDHFTLVQIADETDTNFVKENRKQHTLQVPRLIVPRTAGSAHHLANLAAYKGGKSYGGAAFLTGFAILPQAHVQLIGVEYATAEPEFNYLVDFLCSEAGMNMKYRQLLMDARGGRMRLQLKTGALFEAASWENNKKLKGRRIDCYYWAEAYQLPGMQTFNTLSQNLREKKGFSVWTTTPDEPWVEYLHRKGHPGGPESDPDWHCTCGVDASCNPFTYDQAARDRDDPDKNGIMTRERYAIAWQGLLGTFIGRVYAYSRGQNVLTPLQFPMLFTERTVRALEQQRGVTL